MQDLHKIFDEAKNRPGNSNVAGDPSRWPDVAGVIAVAEAMLRALYDEDGNRKN